MKARDHEVHAFRLRVAGFLAVRYLLRFSFAWIMVWAAAVILLRVGLRVPQQPLLWGLLGVLPVLAASVALAVRRAPSARAVRAVLDRHGELGGLLMAAGEQDLGPWQERITRLPRPVVRFQSRQHAVLLVSSLAFLAIAFLMPDRYLPAGQQRSLELGAELQRLGEKLEVLKEEEIVPPEKAELLEKDLQRTCREASGSDPAKTVEAIDHLEQSLAKLASEAAEEAIKQTEAAGRLQELAEALKQVEGRMDPKQFAEAMKELARMAQEAAAENQALAEGLSDELAEALKECDLSPEQLEELAEALKECKNCQQGKLARLVKARLVDIAQLDRLEEADELDEADLIALLEDCEDGEDLGAIVARSQLPGRGGVTRGRADAAMSWSEGTERGNADFKEKVLQPSAVASLKESRLAGISTADPTSPELGGGSSGGALAGAKAGGGGAHAQVILPEHEKAVRRYFQREKK